MMIRCGMHVAVEDLRKNDTLDDFGKATVHEKISHGRGWNVRAFYSDPQGLGDVLTTIEFPEGHYMLQVERMREVADVAVEYKRHLVVISTMTWYTFCKRTDREIANKIVAEFSYNYRTLSPGQIVELARIVRAV